MPVNWTAENDRKLLLNLITTLSTKDINAEALASLFPGATPKAILERVAKLRRELKAANGAAGATTSPGNTKAGAGKIATTIHDTTKATTTAPATTATAPGTIKDGTDTATAAPATTKAAATSTTATGQKRGRQVEEGDATGDVAVKKRGRVPGRAREMIAARLREMEEETEKMKRARVRMGLME